MLSEQVKRLLGAPPLSTVQQGIDSYPRVIDQRPHGDNHMLVTFSLPGLVRAQMIVPLAEWIASGHLDTHPAQVRNLSRLLPPLIPD